jgi:hypothetical protein
MKKGLKRNNRSFLYQLLIVNKSAGWLRFVLFTTILFILWSLIARIEFQSTSFLSDLLKLNSKPSTFTADIFQNIIQMYFSPSAIILTIVPLFIFLITRNLFSCFLSSLLPSNPGKLITKFLNNCAFSLHQKQFDFGFEKNTDLENKITLLSILGGPSKVTFPPNSIAIISNLRDGEYYALRSKDLNRKFDYAFSFGEKLLSVHSLTNYRLRIDGREYFDSKGREVQLNNFNILIYLDEPNIQADPISITKISKSEAIFLSNLSEKGKDIFTIFIDDEINLFLNTEYSLTESDIQSSLRIKQDQNNSTPRAKNYTHLNHKNLIAKKIFTPNKIIRKHKHTIYQYIKKQKMSDGDNQDYHDKLNSIELKIVEYLNNQFQNFFDVTQIHISRISID